MSDKELCDEYFLNRGYQKYDKTQFQRSDIYLYNFQKDLMMKGKNIFIDVHKISETNGCRNTIKVKSGTSHFQYTYSCRLYKKDTHAPVNMELLIDD